MTNSVQLSAPIAIFDSGVGGLSIYQELKKQLPNENFVYLADQKHAPYGKKSATEIRALTLRSLKFLLSPQFPRSPRFPSNPSVPQTPFPSPKLIVVACNTSTVSGIDFYRTKFPSVPIIGTVPVVKTAAETTKNNHIAILSTIATAKSKYQKDLIKKFCTGYQINPIISNPRCRDAQLRVSTKNNKKTIGNKKIVLNIGCPNLVSFIEQGITSGTKLEQELLSILKPVIDVRCDTLVLGCTHYPFLKKTISRLLISNFKFQISNFQVLDSSAAIARQTKRILEKNKLLNSEPKPPTPSKPPFPIFFTTRNREKFSSVIQTLIHLKTTPLQINL